MAGADGRRVRPWPAVAGRLPRSGLAACPDWVFNPACVRAPSTDTRRPSCSRQQPFSSSFTPSQNDVCHSAQRWPQELALARTSARAPVRLLALGRAYAARTGRRSSRLTSFARDVVSLPCSKSRSTSGPTTGCVVFVISRAPGWEGEAPAGVAACLAF